MEDGRLEIYREIEELFAEDARVREVVLRESLKEGRADRFSDIEVDGTAAPHCGRLQRGDIGEHPVAPRLKVWPMACKYLFRGEEGAAAQTRRHAGTVLPDLDVAGWSAARVQKEILDELQFGQAPIDYHLR